MESQCLIFLLSLVLSVAHCYPPGAGPEACTDIYTEGQSGTSQDLDTNPFQLSLSDFDSYGGEFFYVPGVRYTCELTHIASYAMDFTYNYITKIFYYIK